MPQDDVLLPTLTVAESLHYMALLRLPATLTPDQVQARVWGVIRELGLEHVAGARVGGSLAGGRGISGGERRRTTIGMELVSDPAVLVLDEPTSGLDSFAALNLMCTLKSVSVLACAGAVGGRPRGGLVWPSVGSAREATRCVASAAPPARRWLAAGGW